LFRAVASLAEVAALLHMLIHQPWRLLLPPLPDLPIIIRTSSASAAAPATAPSVTLPADSPEPQLLLDSLDDDSAHELSARKIHARVKRAVDKAAKHKKGAQLPKERHSVRLREKEAANFVDMSTKASRLKALKNELAGCSKDLQVQVKHRGLLRKRTLNATDLRAMAGTAGLSASAAESLNQVLKSSK